MRNNYTRKDFLKIMGMGTAVLSMPASRLFAQQDYKPNLGIQIYTVRRELEKDFEGTMKMIADIGYKGVETYFLPEEIPLERASKVLNDLGLEVFSMHADLPVGDKRDIALKMADAYKCDLVVYHGWPQMDLPATDKPGTPAESAQAATGYMQAKGPYHNEEELKKTTELYNEVTEFLKSKGLRFGLHNHWFELEENQDGIVPLYYLKEHLSNDVVFEIDTYWATIAGLDPAKVVKDFGSQAKLLHIKDGPGEKWDPMYKHVPAGQGALDFSSIVKAGGENIKWVIVEFDEYEKNIFDGIKDSYSYLTKNGLAAGRK